MAKPHTAEEARRNVDTTSLTSSGSKAAKEVNVAHNSLETAKRSDRQITREQRRMELMDPGISMVLKKIQDLPLTDKAAMIKQLADIKRDLQKLQKTSQP